MRIWNIVPFEGVGDLRFGDTRSSVRNLLKSSYRSFIKAPGVTIATDAYDVFGLHLYYDQDDRLEFIEIFRPGDPIYNDIHFFDDQQSTEDVRHRMVPLSNVGEELPDENLQRILAQLNEQGHASRYDDDGYYFDKLGFVLYVPDRSIEAISAYRQGYYDD